MTATDARRWAESAGALDGIRLAVDDAPPIPDLAGGLLRRLDFPAAGALPPAPVAGTTGNRGGQPS